jgi:hypothetical membrane protein
VGPATFLAAVVASSILQEDYSWRREYISGLSAVTAKHPWVMVGGFVAAGICTIPFALALHIGISEGRGSAAGPLLIALSGPGLAAVGLLQNDCSDALRACKEQLKEYASWHSVAHDLVSWPTFFCLVVGPLVLARRMARDPRWLPMARFTVFVLPVIAAVMVVDGLEVAGGWGGLVQRSHILLLLTWAEAMAVRLLLVAVVAEESQ